jgi:hypothetical protein
MKSFKDSFEATLRDQTVTVRFEHTPEDPPVFYYRNGDGYPGAPAETEILEVTGPQGEINDLSDEETEELLKLAEWHAENCAEVAEP